MTALTPLCIFYFTMETARVSIALSGDLNNVVYLNDISVPEAAVLRTLHGRGSVSIVYIEAMNKRAHAVELKRLRGKYDAAVIDKLFPGESPKLPVHFSDIGMSEPVEVVRNEVKVVDEEQTEDEG